MVGISDQKPARNGVKYWCQSQIRIGLKTIERKKFTALEVKGISKVQWNFKAYYLYSAVAPQTGESFCLQFSHLDGMCFQLFLDPLAEKYPDNLNIIQLDKARFHQSSILKIPSGYSIDFSTSLLSQIESY
ncbi:hypothetical protein QUB05_29030 [Microcoleus sp. F10-C6]|uniref:hypothetical protein n=1 Tax=unclassified Microcoleus TaxID=2642155 RepID=UPI002FD52361